MTEIDRVVLPVQLRDRMLRTVLDVYPQKSFGYLITDRGTHEPTDFIRFEDNLRNHDGWRGEFESRGRYFVENPDAGFVASPAESWRVLKLLRERGMREVAVFHTHRRHPGNFSGIDYDLHVGRFDTLWHMIISLRNPQLPQVRAFAVCSAGVRELGVRLSPETPTGTRGIGGESGGH